MKHTTYEELNDTQKKLLLHAQEVMEQSYSPYSNFLVGAALLTHDNTIITGTNFENAAYGECICAERAAILNANSRGYRHFKAISIIAKHKDFEIEKVAAPCGSCRQVLYEASKIYNEPLEVILSSTNMKSIIISSIDELLPLAFGPQDLGIDIKSYQN